MLFFSLLDKEYEFNDYIESYQEFLKIIKKRNKS